jgi:hypothetical protein
LISRDSSPLSSDDYDVCFVDLNNDGRLEAIALASLWKTGFAGTGGGTMFVFAGTKDGRYQFISSNAVTRKPIYVRQRTNSGWHDLVVHSSGGDMESSARIMVFGGKGYPTNPSTEPKTIIMESDVMIIGDAEEDKSTVGGEPRR